MGIEEQLQQMSVGNVNLPPPPLKHDDDDDDMAVVHGGWSEVGYWGGTEEENWC
ncbi:hypothetical protein CASFOL_031752 [Castilleja foliolosa]|uniref:Uncharacterized protein n=1 Tax=Castilleja foliolosa TaxID=1961234 RepID=A0ABD3C6L5_9LAMI